MWPAGRRKKMEKHAKQYEAVIVIGCDSATETVRDSLRSSGCKVIKGMEVGGITNAKMRFRLPCNVSLEDSKITPISQQRKEVDVSD